MMSVRTTHEEIPSTAAIAGHPVHPMLIPFPIAFLVGALFCDVVFATNSDPFWATVAMWLIAGGVVTGVIAAVFGIVDFLSKERVREIRIAWYHMIGNAIVMVLAFINLVIRLNDPAEAAVPGGLILSLIIGLILVVTGWLGGEMSYRYKVGVNSEH